MKKYRRNKRKCRAMFYDGTNAIEIIKWLRKSDFMADEYRSTQFPDDDHSFIRIHNVTIIGLYYETHSDEIRKNRWIVKEWIYRHKDDTRNPVILYCWTSDTFEATYEEVIDE